MHLQMPEAAGPVHDEEKAKSLVRLLTTTHQSLLSHLDLACRLDFPNTCTKQWVWTEVSLDGAHLPWPLQLSASMNDGCWLRARLQWAGISSGQCNLFFLHVLPVLVQAVLCGPVGIPASLAGLLQPPFLPASCSCGNCSWAVTWAAPSPCCRLPSFMVSFSWGSLFYLLQDCDTTWSIHYKGCERIGLRDGSLW